jgi:hypothetical protein
LFIVYFLFYFILFLFILFYFFLFYFISIYFSLDNFNWKKIELTEDEAPCPRYGHTSVLYKKEIFIFGGLTPKEYFKPKEDILIFNIGNFNY